MEQIHVYLPEDRAVISLRGAFAYKDRLKGVPGAKWNPTFKRWEYPLSPSAADALLSEFRVEFPLSDRSTLEAIALNVRQARLVKSCDEGSLAEIPHENCPSWTHQRRAFHFARHLPGTLLSMDMGTGKTKVAINLFLQLNKAALLVVCPFTVVDVWPAEFAKHCPKDLLPEIVSFGEDSRLTIQKKEMAARQCLKLAKAKGRSAVVVVNYESAWRDPFASFILHAGFDMAILDECHRIKSPGGKASMFFARLGRAIRLRVGLTGTPMPHSPLDCYAQFRFLDPGIFGTSFARFKARYAQFGGFQNKQVKGFQNQDELNRKFYSISFRVEKRDVLDLPPVVHTERYGVLTGEARDVYLSMEHEFYSLVDDRVITASNALVKLLRLHQITSGFIDDVTQISTAKESMLRECLGELPEEEPVVVFCLFQHDLDVCRRVTAEAGRKCYEVSGRHKDLKEWQRSHTGDVLSVQIRSGGVGVDLTRSRYAIYYSIGFSLGDYDQSLARIDRPGQKRSTINIHLIIKNTVDVKIYSALRDKKQVVTSILQDR